MDYGNTKRPCMHFNYLGLGSVTLLQLAFLGGKRPAISHDRNSHWDNKVLTKKPTTTPSFGFAEDDAPKATGILFHPPERASHSHNAFSATPTDALAAGASWQLGRVVGGQGHTRTGGLAAWTAVGAVCYGWVSHLRFFG